VKPVHYKDAVTLCLCTKYPEEIGATEFKNTILIERETELALISYNPKTDTIHVSVRGTEDWIKQGKTNLDFLPEVFQARRVKYKACDGFFDATNKIIVPLLESLRTFRHNHKGAKLVLSGFSRGGAVILLLLPFLTGVTEVHTFGGPRTYYKSSVRQINKLAPIFRWVNNNDIVTRLPPRKIARHVGKLMYLKGNGKLMTNIPGRYIIRCFIWGILSFIDPFRDHRMKNEYYKHVMKVTV
jgi:hypothetical protein